MLRLRRVAMVSVSVLFTTSILAPQAMAAGVTGPITGLAGKCVDDAGSDTSNGTKIDL